MARPKADHPPVASIMALADASGCLTLRVTPGARVESLVIDGDRLLVKVRTKPEDGKANAAVLDLLAAALGIASSRLHLLRGTTGRDKQVRIISA
jgi:uncharacterized protein YggU (UPF0235/DUF167 family)